MGFASARELLRIENEWWAHARAAQRPVSGVPVNWLVLGGRGAGKTRLGAEWVNAHARGYPPFAQRRYGRIALVGETLADVREVMVEGPSGIIASSPRDRPRYEPSRRRLVWSSGAVALVFSSEDPDSLRGPQFDAAWCDELGCPAVDKGPNQPNVFPDPKSSENGVPWFSNGGRSDVASLNLAAAHFDQWDAASDDFDAAANPVSDVYGGRMVDASRLYLWAWDARPFPAFPTRTDVWSDGSNWLLGHWLNGRMNGVAVADLINAILADHGLEAADVTRVHGTVGGYVLSDPATARGALEPVVDLFGLTVSGEGGKLVFATEDAADGAAIELDEFAIVDDRPLTTRTRIADHDLPAEVALSFIDPSTDYQAGTARAVLSEAPHRGQRHIGFPGVLEPGMAESLLADWLRRRWTAREQISVTVEQTRIDLTPGGTVSLTGEEGAGDFLITSVDAGAAREISARRVRRLPPSPWKTGLQAPAKTRVPRAGPPLALLVDLPMLPGATVPEEQLRIALRAKPWIPHAVYASPMSSGFERRGLAMQEAAIGTLRSSLGAGFEGRFDNAAVLEVEMLHGELASAPDIQVLNGANLAAIRSSNGEWEVIQFAAAEEVEPSVWHLGRLLRGRFGTRPAMLSGAEAGSHFVLLDGAVVPCGLKAHEIGLTLNWRVGPLGYDFASPAFASIAAVGGERARRPLSPVHLAIRKQPDGSRALTWTRRGRIDADRGLAGNIPLGEETEAYLVEVATVGGTVMRRATVAAAAWTYEAASIAADFPVPPGAVDVTVRQLGSGGYPGDAATLRFNPA